MHDRAEISDLKWVNTVSSSGLQAKKTQLEVAGTTPDYRILGNMGGDPIDSSLQARSQYSLENSKRPSPEEFYDVPE
ncbi:MAG: hypothetical protein C5B58_05055 [Acidobacteria bacterium]|nr:MAG: hypothetical protein C5B58_05055 [Acidobacteriota bacterium]